MSNDAVVDIADVFADAVRVLARDVAPGDYVFDAFGGRHEVRTVRNTGLEVRIKRTDGWMSHHAPTGTITIVKGNES